MNSQDLQNISNDELMSHLSDTGRLVRFTYLVIGLILAVLFLWSILVPLDEGVPTYGMVTVSTKSKPVQHIAGGIVDKVFAKEGDFVKKNDLLIQLDAEAAKASYLIEKNKLIKLNTLVQELNATKELVKDGYLPLVRQLELERQVSELMATQNVIQHVQNELNRTSIRSPIDGQVVGLAVQSKGAVVQSGQILMQIVPQKEELLLETKIPTHLIDRVHVNDPVDVRFSTFAKSPQLVVAGKVDSLSSDVLSDPSTKMTYYLGRISITNEGMSTLGDRALLAGMPAEVIIKTGSRTLFQYIMHPLTKRLAASLKEE